MVDITYVTIPEMTAATAENLSDNMLFETSVPDQNASSGYSSKKVTRGQILSALKEDLNNKANVIISSASGSIAHFEDGAEANAVSVIAHIEPVQSGSGDPSPTNVRPISGWTGAKVTRTGKNLLNYSTFEVGTIDSNMGQTQAANNRVRSGFIFLTEGQYTISSLNGFDTVFDVYDLEKNFIKTESTTAWNATPHTYTILGDRYVRILFRKSNNSTITLAELTGEQLELGSTATDYEPYQGETYTTTLGQTVYGGSLDMVSGVLTVDRAMIDLGTLNYTYEAFVPRFYSTGIKTSVKPPQDNDHEANAISSAYKVTAFERLYTTDKLDGTFAVGNTGTLNFINRTYTTAADFKSAMSGVQLVYELATPQTIQLTPQQVALLVGTNNIWSDANGDTDVTYKADTKLYIEQLTKPTEDDMVANTAIQSGKFFMVGNRLFLSTSVIASGDTINPGTNCTELSLADALNNLN